MASPIAEIILSADTSRLRRASAETSALLQSVRSAAKTAASGVAAVGGKIASGISGGVRGAVAALGALRSALSAVARQGVAEFQALKRQIESFGESARAIGFVSAGVFAAVSGGAAYAVKAASDLNEEVNKFRVVFGASADATAEWASVTAAAVNRSDGELLKYLASLQNLFVPMGIARDEAVEMSKSIATLAIDLASFNNIADQDALDRLRSGIAGNVEALRTLGIVLTEASVNQQLLNMGVEGGNKNATEAQKAVARMNLIIERTRDAQGDAVRTSEEFANRLRGLNSATIEASQTIGAVFLPIANEVVRIVTETVRTVADWVKQNPELTKSIVLATAAISGLGVALGAAALAASTLGSILGGPMIIAAGAAAAAILIFKPTVEDVVNAIIRGVSVMVSAFQNWRLSIGVVIDQAQLSITGFVLDVGHFFTVEIPAYLSFVAENWRQVWASMVDLLLSVLINIGDNIRRFFSDPLNFEFKGLTDGWTVTMGKLPEITKRELSEVEKTLRVQIDSATEEISKGADEVEKSLRAKLGPLLGLLGIGGEAAPTITPPKIDIPKLEPFKTPEGFAPKDATEKAARSFKTFEGLGDAFNRIAEAAATRDTDAAKATAKNTEESARTLRVLEAIGSGLAGTAAATLDRLTKGVAGLLT